MSVTLTDLVAIPLLANLLVLLGIWFYYLIHDHGPGIRRAKNRIYRCQVCEHVYLDARDVPLSRCSRCGCLNEAVRM